jgi:hypothetical protein
MADVFGDKQSYLRVYDVSFRLNGGMGKDLDNGELTTLNKNVNDEGLELLSTQKK